MKTAKQIGLETGSPSGARQRLYKLSEPVHYSSREEGDKLSDYVIVSAVDLEYSGPETYIFPADSDGNILDWMELNGSFRGSLDHAKALRGAGYEIVGEPVQS